MTAGAEERSEPGRRAVGTVTILTVHGIGEPKRALDPGEDRTWISVDEFERVLDAVAGRSDVRLTFDDGNDSDVEIALPRLVDRGLVAEFFLLAGRLDRAGSVDQAAARALLAAGMRIGSHGFDHVDWRALDDAAARRELVEAAAALAELTGAPVTRVAVPFGSYDRVVLRRLRGAGVHRVYTSDGGPARASAWLQPRTSLHSGLSAAGVRDLVDPHATVLRRARRVAARSVKRWRGPTRR
jgi:peptidoglycan/xylan/chitin deacetylase (PgdA/CDA1 family)